jgi:hypothetical protein
VQVVVVATIAEAQKNCVIFIDGAIVVEHGPCRCHKLHFGSVLEIGDVRGHGRR